MKREFYHMNSMKYKAVRCVFDGMTYKETAAKVFRLKKDDPEYEEKLKKAYNKVFTWSREPEFERCYKELCKQEAMPRYSKAMALFDAQIEHKNPWVAQGAARELANRYGSAIMGEEQNTVTVRIEGAPELGEPEED